LDMAKESNKPIRFILNRVDSNLADRILVKVGREKVIGVLPFSRSVQEKGLVGEALDPQLLNIDAVKSFVLEALHGVSSVF
jgi:CO dehydrogenase nickel-insertion accessory protein CooC1